MAFEVMVVEPEAFDAWLTTEGGAGDGAGLGAGATRRAGLRRKRLRRLPHRSRHRGAAGTIGPDLTHVASRQSLAAATLSTGADDLERLAAASPITSSPAR